MHIRRYNSRDELHAGLAADWLALVRDGNDGEEFSFALAGGTTPAPVYRDFAARLQQLQAQKPVRVKLVATDERWVPNSDSQSNEGLIESCFPVLKQDQDACQLVSLKTAHASPAQALSVVSERLNTEFPDPFSAVLLGMGTDGHFASLFPGQSPSDELDARVTCVSAYHPATGQPRISLSMSRIVDTRRIWLLITGEEKLRVLQDCERVNDKLPIARLLRNARCEVEVYWSAEA